MKVQIVANGNVCLVISPENEMEASALKQLMKQSDNEIAEIRSGIQILTMQINTGILIGKMGTTPANKLIPPIDADEADEKNL